MYSRCKSIIVYCTRREQTARVATLIKTQMKDFYGDDSDDDSVDSDATPPRNKKGAFTLSCDLMLKLQNCRIMLVDHLPNFLSR